MRTILFSLLGLTASLALGLAFLAAEQPAGPEHHAHAFEQCAKACNDCQRSCDSCATHCRNLLAQGKKDHETTLRTCLDCADFCAAAARITARQGVFSDLICNDCAEACQRCGKECAKFDDEHMKKCAEECSKCEKACREMLKHIAQAKENAK